MFDVFSMMERNYTTENKEVEQNLKYDNTDWTEHRSLVRQISFEDWKNYSNERTTIIWSICVLRIAKVGSILSPYLGNVEEQRS